MKTRILIPENLTIVVTSSNRNKLQKAKEKSSITNLGDDGSPTSEKPTSSGIDLLDSDNENKTTDSGNSDDMSTADLSSSDLNTNPSISFTSSISNSDCDSDNIPVSSEFSRKGRDRSESRKRFRKIREKSKDEIRIVASARIPNHTSLDPDDGVVRIVTLKGVQDLPPNDVRHLFKCFDRVVPDPDNNRMQIRLCNWIRFVRRNYNANDPRVNLVGKIQEGKPIFTFTREVLPDEEIITFFDLGSPGQDIKMDGLDFVKDKVEVMEFEAPLDLSKSPSSTKSTLHSLPKSLLDVDDSRRVYSSSPEIFSHRLTKPFSLGNALQPMAMKLFQPHLYSPPSSSTSTSTTNPTMNSPTNSNSALHSPNSGPTISQQLNLLSGGIGLLKPILRTRGRERSLLPCEICGKAFDRPSLLKRHMRTHTGEKPHVCDVCNKGFSTSSSLNTHRRIHSGEKPHQCGTCGKRFTASSNLYYHKMTHNKEKPHKCTLCGKSFPTPGDLKSHQYVHSGSWPYNCTLCSRGFSKQTNLRNHLLLHSGDKPHSCQICGKKFALACNLRAHVRTHEEDPVTSCSTCKRTFLTSLNMLVNGQCRSCILNMQSSTNSSVDITRVSKSMEITPPIKIEQSPDMILSPPPAFLPGFQLPHAHPALYDSLGFTNGRPNPFLEQLFEWNWRVAKETAGNLGLMQQKLLESQMLAAQLMSVSNSPGISDIFRFRPVLPHSTEFNTIDGTLLHK